MPNASSPNSWIPRAPDLYALLGVPPLHLRLISGRTLTVNLGLRNPGAGNMDRGLLVVNGSTINFNSFFNTLGYHCLSRPLFQDGFWMMFSLTDWFIVVVFQHRNKHFLPIQGDDSGMVFRWLCVYHSGWGFPKMGVSP